MSGGYIDNYATADNPVVDITGVPIQFLLNFQDTDAAAATDHPATVLPVFAAVQQALATPLNGLLDKAWSGTPDGSGKTLHDKAVEEVEAMIPSAAAKQGQTATNISGALPTTGALRALAIPNGPLLLSYWLAGADFTFQTNNGFATWRVRFDIELLTILDLPNWPSLTLKGAGAVFDANIGPANVGATLAQAWELFLDYLNDRPLSLFQGSEGDVDSSAVPVDLNQFTPLLNLLAQLTTPLGFLRCGAFVDAPSRTLNLRLIHPLDPAPQIQPDGDAFAGFVPLDADPLQLPAGGQVVATCASVPLPDSAHLGIGWNDTTSGNVRLSEIQWGPINGPFQTVSKDRSLPNVPDSGPQFTPAPQPPPGAYQLRVRDCDQLTCTPWSGWAARGLTSSTVTFVLDSAGGSVVLGTATPDATGKAQAKLTVPAGTPPGPHKLALVLNGKRLTDITITVLAPGAAAQPTLKITDPLLAVIPENTSFTLRGEAFHPGPVAISLDSTGGAPLGTATAGADGTFVATFTWPLGVVGRHAVVASQTVSGQTLQASTFESAVPPSHIG